MTAKPNILTVVGQRIELRRAGREHVGLCPFHHDRRPSLYVNEAKQVFLCRSCGEHGDVISFIMKLDGLSFPETKRFLGIAGNRSSQPPLTPSRKYAAEIVAAWVNEQQQKFNTVIADVMFRRDLADEFGFFELAESLDRELIMLRSFHDTLKYPHGAADLLAMRPAIESITARAEVQL